MTKTVYTIGYIGRTPEELTAILEAKGAVLLDIRFSPMSRVPQWRGYALARQLPGRYFHVKAFGNQNYKSAGPIVLVDYEAGKAFIEAQSQPVVLLCACKDYAICHRATVAEKLRADGFQVEEIGGEPKPPAQIPLF